MMRLIHSLKQRLYDWPSFGGFLKNWEVRGVREHQELISLLEAGRFEEAGCLLREVHWSFEAQEDYIRLFYQTDRPA
jgi:DNA-binding GntR family transcriptional regulator